MMSRSENSAQFEGIHIPQPRHISFLLQELLVDAQYREGGGNTRAQWTPGCFGTLNFVAWDGFEKIVQEGMKSVDRLSVEEVQGAKTSLGEARDFIEDARLDHDRMEEMEGKKLLLSQAEVRARKEYERGQKRKIGEVEDGEKTTVVVPYIQKPVTNSTSISSLHDCVLRGIVKLLRELYKPDVIRVQSNKCSSESVRVSDSTEDMTEGIPLPENLTPDLSLYRVTLKDTELVSIPVCCFEFKGPSLDLSGLTTVEFPQNSNNRSSPGEVIAVEAEPIQEHGGTNFVSRAQEDGQAVGRTDMPGRLLDEGRGRRGEAHQELRRDPMPPTTSGQVNMGRDLTTSDEASPGDTRESQGLMGYENIYKEGSSASQVAGHFNALFSRIEYLDTRLSDFAAHRQVLYPVAQTICQALLSRSGCGFLYNHQTGIAFRAVEVDPNNSNRITVFVTGVIGCNERPGNVAAMFSLAKYCIDEDIDINRDEQIGRMRRLHRIISNAAYKAPSFSSRSSGEQWLPSSDTGTDSHSNRTGQLPPSAGRQVNSAPNELDRRGRQPESPTAVKVSPMNSSSTFMRLEVSLPGAGRTSAIRKCGIKEELAEMFMTNKGIVATGSSGIILRGLWRGNEVAIKIWSGELRSGLNALRREIRIYKKLQSNCPSILGSAVPKLMLGWEEPNHDSVYRNILILVTEFVGKEVLRDINGDMWLAVSDGYVKVDVGDEPHICESALRSLKELHDNGFAHGDVALRNLRISCRRIGSVLSWTCWWLDLGISKEVRKTSDRIRFDLDRKECISLFRVAKAELN